MFRHTTSVAFALAALALSALALPPAADDVKPKRKAPAPAAAQRAVLDPRTGELTNGPMPGRARRASLPPSGPYPEEAAPGGGFMVTLDGRFLAATVARIDAEGNLTLHCVTTDEKSLKTQEARRKTEDGCEHPH